MNPATPRLRLLAQSLVMIAMTSGGFSLNAASTGLLLVTNKGNHTLSIIDPEAGKEIAAIAEDGTTGHEVIAGPEGKFAYVPIYGNSGVGGKGTDGQLIRVIDLDAKKISETIDLGKGMRPHCPLFNPHDGLLYVTTELDQSVSIIDPQTLTVTGAIPTGQPQSHMLALSHDGLRGYTANVSPGTVSVLDLRTRALVTTIQAAPHVQRISVSPDDHWVVTADQTAMRLVVIDAATNEVAMSIPITGHAYGTAFTPDGKWLVVAIPGKHQVGVIDWAARKLVHSLEVPKSPQEVLIRPDGAKAYVSCDASKQIAVIDTNTWTVEKLIDAGPGADGLAWAEKR
ncbi:MAG TPA: beta-propeller fold lactonase family protein [Rariglobus sp.]|jgi:YVTN family beta-propeller protein|nr:beta-propeller fold lactonase family protein [Rariglobus sp.]